MLKQCTHRVERANNIVWKILIWVQFECAEAVYSQGRESKLLILIWVQLHPFCFTLKPMQMLVFNPQTEKCIARQNSRSQFFQCGSVEIALKIRNFPKLKLAHFSLNEIEFRCFWVLLRNSCQIFRFSVELKYWGSQSLQLQQVLWQLVASLVNFQCKGSQFCSWKILRPTLTFQSIWFEVNRMENEFFHHFVQTQWPCPIEQMMRLEVKILEHSTDILHFKLIPNWGIN